MSKEEDLGFLLDKIGAFKKMYDHMRVVDPVNKTIMHYYGDGILLPDHTKSCHELWEKGKVCENCVAMRAYNEGETMIKIEYTQKTIYLITAVPVEFNNSNFIIELLKDTTSSMFMNEKGLNSEIELKKLLDSTNEKAVMDELTGIYNKRFLLERLPVDIVNAHLNDSNLSIIMADIDHFKKINDVHGHLAGDFILREFAFLLKENTRGYKGWLARFGGEEFLISLQETDKDAAYNIAERMRKAVENKAFDYNGNTIYFTSSFGICSLAEIESLAYEDLVACADNNLYKAKKGGRNCVAGRVETDE